MKNKKKNIKDLNTNANLLAIEAQKKLKGGGDPPPIGGVWPPLG